VKIWLDAQLSPKLANWMRATFDVHVLPMRDLGLLVAWDETIFMKAKKEVDAVITKDKDFLALLAQFGPPPKVLWVTVGNVNNRRMKEVFTAQLPDALRMLREGEALVEITG
jgi:predicted nuclease of predicted toxin-antitoxin system